jgi:ParB family chromosome partitioning protein
MTFKDSNAQFQTIDVTLLDTDPKHARQNINEDTIKGLFNSIQKVGIIHPLVVRPTNESARYIAIVGERRRQAAIR